jgi:diguanylate cyclase (GGDEF)-like protein
MRVKHVPQSDANQVIRLLWPFLAVIFILVTLAVVSIDIMSSLRAYIGAESVWSKGEKDATFFLHLYAENGDEVLYQRHAEAMEGLLHLRLARDILDRTQTDMHTGAGRTGPGRLCPVGRGEAPHGCIASFAMSATSRMQWTSGSVATFTWTSCNRSPVGFTADFLTGRELMPDSCDLQEEIFQINEEVAPLARGFSSELSSGRFARSHGCCSWSIFAAATVLMLLTVWHVRRLVVQRKLTEKALRRSEARAKATLGSIGEAVIATSLSGEIEFINPAAERILCTTSALCLGRPFSDAFSLLYERSREPEKMLAKLASDGLLGDHLDDQFVEMILVSRSGVEVNVRAVVSRITGSPFYLSDLDGSNDGHHGYVIILRNMTREKEYIRSLAWQASHDSLTDLVNRSEFERQLAASLAGAKQLNAAVCDVLLVFDLDRFKIVNDTCGHAAGDGMLRAISTHLSKIFRAGDTFGRLGGDEFGALLRGYDRAQAMTLADALLHSANTFCYQWEAQQFKTSLSIGLLILDEPGITAESAMHLTDIACFVAKERGRDRVQEADLNDSDLATHANEASWARRLKHALEHDLFCLYAQPIRNLRTGDQQPGGLNKVELLLRMIDTQGGPAITPDKFIPAAERYGLMTTIDRWVVRTALRALSRTPAKQYSEYAINLSGASVGDARFLHYVVEQIQGEWHCCPLVVLRNHRNSGNQQPPVRCALHE